MSADEQKLHRALYQLVRWVEVLGVEKNPVFAGISLRPLESARRVLCETDGHECGPDVEIR